MSFALYYLVVCGQNLLVASARPSLASLVVVLLAVAAAFGKISVSCPRGDSEAKTRNYMAHKYIPILVWSVVCAAVGALSALLQFPSLPRRPPLFV